jgi:diacylglycerol kinase (ATP)
MKNKLKRIFKNKTFIQSVNNSVEGLRYAFKNEKNLKIHSAIAVLVLLFSLFQDLSKIELLIVVLSITLVIITELINTAIELIVNVIIKIYHPKAKIIKDVAAGAVFVASLNSIVVAYIIFIDRLGTGLGTVRDRLKSFPPSILLIALVITVFMVIVVKLFYKRGTPFQGGLPSGHTAVAFAVATSITLWINNTIASILCLSLALLVAQSRVEGKIHSVFEAFAGAALGIFVTLFIFKVILL